MRVEFFIGNSLYYYSINGSVLVVILSLLSNVITWNSRRITLGLSYHCCAIAYPWVADLVVRELVAIMNEAERHNVTDLVGAVELLEEYESMQREGVSGLSDKAAYVRQLLLMDTIISLEKNELGVPLLFKGVFRVRLYKQSVDQAFKDKEQAKLTALAAKAGVAEGQPHWQPTDADYREPFSELCGSKVAEFQRRIEELVFKIKLVVEDRRATDSQNSKARYTRNIKTLRGDVADLLEQRHSWLSKNTSEEVEKPDLDQVCTGVFSWHDGIVSAATTDDAAKRHFARRYRTAAARKRRLLEEKDVIYPQEVWRCLCWLEQRASAALSNANAAKEESEKATAASSWDVSAQEDGVHFIWNREYKRLKRMLESGRKKLLPLILQPTTLAQQGVASATPAPN